MKTDVTSFLGNMPDEFAIKSEPESKDLAVLFGVIHRLDDPGTTGPRVKVCVFNEHPSHWVFFVRWFGRAVASENGIKVHFGPKSKVTYEEMKAVVHPKHP